MSERQENKEHIKKHASKRLRTNLRILSIVFIILMLITIYELIISKALFSQVILALAIGFVVGVISSRMFKISWDKDQEKVVGRIDIYGVIVLVLFIIFELNRTWVADLFAGGEALGAISLMLVTAALLGRIVGTSRAILRVLMNENRI